MNNQCTYLTINAIIEAIERNETFLLLTHLNPDGDGVGSLVALGRILIALEKSCCLLSPGRIPPDFDFLLEAGEISHSIPLSQEWDVIFLLDIPCVERLPPSLSGQIPSGGKIINIDHHPSNNIRGELNWVDGGASSVGEMLYQLCDTASYPIPAEVATPLYTAILTDTGSFRFSNVTPRALSTAARLVERGADAAAIADRIYGFHPLREYKLLGKALATLQTCCSGRVAFMWITQKMLKDTGGSLLDASDFENLPRTVKGTEIAILFKQKEDCRTVQVSLRSKKRLHDVSRLAESFGGGGHPAAAGCILSGSMASVQEQVLRAVERELAQTNPPVPGSSCQKTNVEDHNDSIS